MEIKVKDLYELVNDTLHTDIVIRNSIQTLYDGTLDMIPYKYSEYCINDIDFVADVLYINV